MNKFFNLSDKDKKSFINKEYNKNNRSIREIAQILNTYPNKIRREALRLGLELKPRGQIQSELLQRGVSKNPTEGRERTEKEKDKIAISISNSYTSESKRKLSKISKERSDNRSQDERESFARKSHEGIRQAAVTGSKLEIFLYDRLIEEGFRCVAHEKHLVDNEKMHIDLLLPEEMIAIEVDGISHQQIVWSQKSYENKTVADLKKNGLLISDGYDVIRIKYSRNISRADMIKIMDLLLTAISKTEQYQEIIYDHKPKDNAKSKTKN